MVVVLGDLCCIHLFVECACPSRKKLSLAGSHTAGQVHVSAICKCDVFTLSRAGLVSMPRPRLPPAESSSEPQLPVQLRKTINQEENKPPDAVNGFFDGSFNHGPQKRTFLLGRE